MQRAAVTPWVERSAAIRCRGRRHRRYCSPCCALAPAPLNTSRTLLQTTRLRLGPSTVHLYQPSRRGPPPSPDAPAPGSGPRCPHVHLRALGVCFLHTQRHPVLGRLSAHGQAGLAVPPGSRLCAAVHGGRAWRLARPLPPCVPHHGGAGGEGAAAPPRHPSWTTESRLSNCLHVPRLLPLRHCYIIWGMLSTAVPAERAKLAPGNSTGGHSRGGLSAG